MDQIYSGNFGISGRDTKELLAFARKCRDSEKHELAADYYDEILAQDPNSWEAAYYSMYCRLDCSNIRRVVDSALTIDETMAHVIELIANADLIKQEKYYIIQNISHEIRDLAVKTCEDIKLEQMDSVSFRKNKKLILSWCKALFTIGITTYDFFAEVDLRTANLSTMCLETCNELACKLLDATFSIPKIVYYKKAKDALNPYIIDATATIQVFDSGYKAPKVSFKFF